MMYGEAVPRGCPALRRHDGARDGRLRSEPRAAQGTGCRGVHGRRRSPDRGHSRHRPSRPPDPDGRAVDARLSRPGDDVQAFVDARIAEGADYIKVIYEHAFPTLTKEQLEDVVAAVHRRNTLVVAHVTAQRDARDAIAAGVDGLVHVFADSPPEADFAGFAARHGVFVVPTLSVIEAATGATDTTWWQDDPRLAPYSRPRCGRSLERKMPPGIGAELKLAHAQAAVGALHRAGVPILAGTDAPSPGLAHGLSLHRELELLVLSGLTPLEALASATSEPARAFGFHDRGRIAEGRRADLLLVDGDPTVDIRATRDIVGVWKLGRRARFDRPAARGRQSAACPRCRRYRRPRRPGRRAGPRPAGRPAAREHGLAARRPAHLPAGHPAGRGLRAPLRARAAGCWPRACSASPPPPRWATPPACAGRTPTRHHDRDRAPA